MIKSIIFKFLNSSNAYFLIKKWYTITIYKLVNIENQYHDDTKLALQK